VWFTATGFSEELPLPLQVIGQYLSGKTADKWQEYLQQPGTADGDATARLHNVILPSYQALPLPVKRCFLTFAAYDEDERVPAEHLLSRWAGWELVPGPQASKAARWCLEQLQAACLIHSTRRYNHYDPDDPVCFYMHDVLRDLARMINDAEHTKKLQCCDAGWVKVQLEVRPAVHSFSHR
jgi:hypothetical protein